MSLTLGEKLRQAREERGITISEVAEQTRISALYLGCIENNDYRTLPGGIFNKGFIKSFAKYVGVDEQEAMQDYALLVANQDNEIVDEPKTYRPQVLSNDNYSASRWLTIVFAGVILALMTVGVFMLVRYITPLATQTANTTSNANANSISNLTLANANNAAAPVVPSINDSTVEIKAVKSSVSLVSIVDGTANNALLATDKSKIFQPQRSLKLRYSKSKARNVEMTINGKPIALPAAPDTPTRSVIEFEIDQSNFGRIWESGQVSFNNPPATR